MITFVLIIIRAPGIFSKKQLYKYTWFAPFKVTAGNPFLNYDLSMLFLSPKNWNQKYVNQ
jgi:hypothetical protein